MSKLRILSQIILSIALTLLPFTVLAAPRASGGMDSGGGDPLVNEFLSVGDLISQVIPKSANSQFGINQSDLLQELNVLRTSLEGHKPKLVFLPGETVDCFGAPKLGCVYNGTIFIARESWENQTSFENKVQLTSMELLLRMGVGGRYEKGPEITKLVMQNRHGLRENVQVKVKCITAPDHICLGTSGLLYVDPSTIGMLLTIKIYTDQAEIIEIAPMDRICIRRKKDAGTAFKTVFPTTEQPDLGNDGLALYTASQLPTELPLNGFKVIRKFNVPLKQIMGQFEMLIKNKYAFRSILNYDTNSATIEIRGGSDSECLLPAAGNYR